MTRFCALLLGITVCLTGGRTLGQVTITYAPTTIEAGTPTPVTISITDDSGAGLEISSVAFQFEQTAGLVLDGFAWLVSDFSNSDLWFASDTLPAPVATAFGAGVVVEPNGTLDLASVTVTATVDAGGTTETLTAFPSDSEAKLLDAMSIPLGIAAGRSVEFTVTAGANGNGGAGAGGGGTGGGGAGADPGAGGTGTDPGTGGAPGTDPGAGGAGDVAPDNTSGGSQPGGGMNGGQDAGAPTDTGSGGAPGGGGADAGGGGSTAPGGANDQSGAGSGGANGSTETTPGGSTPLCAVGMIGPGLFTFCCLSFMKLRRRRKW